MRWLEVAPQHLDPGVALGALTKGADPKRMPRRRLLVRFDFLMRPKLTLWALLERGKAEICRKHPGGVEELAVTADPDWFVRWHTRRCTWNEAVGGRHIVVDGPRDLAEAFPTWFRPDIFSHIEPASVESAERRPAERSTSASR